MKIDAVVVTFNRLEKLKECVETLSKFNLRNIFIINNASTDKTAAYLEQAQTEINNLRIFNLPKNLGGAGGFNFGMKKFIENSTSDYVWIMDDDTIPQNAAMELLGKGLENNSDAGFAIGQVYWTDWNLAQMNLPVLSKKQPLDRKVRWVDSASFVAIMFKRQAILKVGYPISEFFIWGDDVEYTNRIVRQGFKGIQIMEAEIIHKMGANVGINILDENYNQGRIKRYFFNYRNRLYLNRQKGILSVIKTLLGRIVWSLRILFSKNDFKKLKLSVLYKGTVAGIFFDPKIEKC